MATTRKTTKKAAKGGKAQKKNAVRTVKHGNVTYSSRPQENPGCSPRCTPPYRYVSQATGLKTTTVKYRHRNLAITSPDAAPKKRTAKRTATKTAKAPSKTVKTVKKAPAKTAVKKTAAKTVKAPAAKKAPTKTVKKAPAVRKTVSPGAIPNTEIRSWYMAKFPTDELGKEIRPKITFAKVWGEMIKGFDYYNMMPGDSVVRERVFDGISDAYKIPYDTVYQTWLNAGRLAVQRMKNAQSVVPSSKKAPAKKTASKTVSCGCAVSPTRPSKPKTVTCGCAQTPAKVKEAILNKAEKEGMNRKELDRHIVVATVPRIEAKAPVKSPASWKVPTVGGKFEGSSPAKSPEVTSISRKDLYEELGIPYKPRKAKKKSVETAPAKRSPAAKVPSASRGVQGRFDAGALKAVAQFIHKMDKDLDMPIFSNDTQFVDSGRVMALRLVSRMPGKSFVGLPLDPSKRDLAVPIESFIKRLNSEVMDVYYKDGRLYYAWKDSPGLSVSTAVQESNNPRRVRFVWSRTRTEGDIMFRTSQAKFASDVKKAIQSTGFKLPSKYNTYKDTAMSMCPPKGAVGYDKDGHIPPQCAGYSAYYLNMIAGLVAKARGSQCIVMFKPNFPLRVVCDLGPYMAEMMLAPVYTPEE